MQFLPAHFPYTKKSLQSTFPFSSSPMKAKLVHIHINLLVFSFQSSAKSILVLPQTPFVSVSSLHSLKPCTLIFSKPFISPCSHLASLFKQDRFRRADLGEQNNRKQQSSPGKLKTHAHTCCSKQAKFSFGLKQDNSADMIKLTLIQKFSYHNFKLAHT